jgi:hypothetical protein
MKDTDFQQPLTFDSEPVLTSHLVIMDAGDPGADYEVVNAVSLSAARRFAHQELAGHRTVIDVLPFTSVIGLLGQQPVNVMGRHVA